MYKDFKVVDCHGDIPVDVCVRRMNGEKNVLDRIHYEKLKNAGIKIQVGALYIDEKDKPFKALEMACKQMNCLLDDIAESKHFMLVKNKKDLEEALNGDKIGIIVDMEGGEPIEGGIDLLRLFFKLGVRIFGLTWNHRNKLADGAYETNSHSGLTTYGKEVLNECKKLGIIVDISHLSGSCIDDLLENYDGIVIASHCSTKAMNDVPRNITDDQISLLCKKGGMIGIPSYPYILSKERPSILTAVEHYVHLTKLVGCEKVGIGGDYIDFFQVLIKEGLVGNEWILPEDEATVGYKSAADIPMLLKKMEENGFEDNQIKMIAGENWIELFKKYLPD